MRQDTMTSAEKSRTSARRSLHIWRLQHVLFLLLPMISTADAGVKPHCSPEGSGPEINACAREDFARSERELNREYKALKASLATDGQARLLSAQRAWLKKRDPDCRALLHEDEGYTIWPSEFDNCRAEANRERTAQLRRWQTPSQK